MPTIDTKHAHVRLHAALFESIRADAQKMAEAVESGVNFEDVIEAYDLANRLESELEEKRTDERNSIRSNG